MFNYFVMVRKTENHLERDTFQVKAFTKKGAISKVIKQLVGEKKNLSETELAVFGMEEYMNLRFDDITDSNRFKLYKP